MPPETADFMSQLKEKNAHAARESMERRLAELKEALGLNDAEAARLEKQMLVDFEEAESLIEGLMKGDFNGDVMQRLTELKHPNLVAERLAKSLGGEAGERLLALNAKERSQKIEGRAMGELGQLQQVLSLSEEQKDAVLQVCVENQAKLYDDTSSTRVAQRAMAESIGGGAATTYLDSPANDLLMEVQTDAMQSASDSSEAPETPDFKTIVDRTVNQRVERFSEIFTPEQSAAYREHLHSQLAPVMSLMDAAGIED